jgi:hypothetical protein
MSDSGVQYEFIEEIIPQDQETESCASPRWSQGLCAGNVLPLEHLFESSGSQSIVRTDPGLEWCYVHVDMICILQRCINIFALGSRGPALYFGGYNL